jgi:uncharacterized protein (TIGR00299 family) protein
MIAYFDCFSGISGDMTLGALVDAGVPLSKIKDELARLPVKGYQLTARKVKRAGLRATKVDVILQATVRSQKSPVRKWKDIEKIIHKSSLSEEIKFKGLSIFRRLFEAEAKVHGGRYDRIHLHELGAIDCIVDIFGSLIGLDILGINTIYSSPINLGSGFINSEHGILPVPAPASVELLKGIPVYSSEVTFELTTPTGAVLISTLSDRFGPMPHMHISKTGVGAGDQNFRRRPNIMRILVGMDKKSKITTEDEVTVLETNIDDMNPQVYEYVMDILFKEGALDVFLTQVVMKKGRPGIKLTVLCNKDKKDVLSDIILKETTSIGLRFYNVNRKTLQREIKSKNTRYGTVRIKESRLGREVHKASPEYEDCKKIAKKFNISLIDVIKAVSS